TLLSHTGIGAFFITEKEKREAIGKTLEWGQGAAASSVPIFLLQLRNKIAIARKSGRADRKLLKILGKCGIIKANR
ncbi:MAG: hypothetical protein MSR67_07850, partial [Oscillospiraceae bacterium]|nr:hypothetical protein [Oscillospiraceae bacterium]